jgi:NADH-quinone oxidoreductase subunit M
MMILPLLLLIFPLLGAVVVIASPPARAKWLALIFTTATFISSVVAAIFFDHWTDSGFGLTADIPWLTELGITLSLGVDSVSLMLVLLTTLLMPLCVWGSFTAVNHRLREYYGWLLAIEAAMIGVFMARDLIFFYICFELTLVPMYFLIAIWGSTNRAKACTKFFIYTFTGSLIALAGLLYVAWSYAQVNAVELTGGGTELSWTFSMPELIAFASTMTFAEQAWVLLALMAGFAVKVPLFPVHTWLPLAHTEAPTAGSVVLAAVLLKLGTYGLYRFVLPMLPDAMIEYAPVIAVLSIIGILYAGLICWVQDDVKRLIAYSSVSHLGFCVLGLVALNPLGVQGSVMYMINHGLSTGALFFLIGMIYERYHTRDMNAMSGLAARMPIWSFFMVFFVLSSVGLPGLNGFVGEFLCLIGTFVATGDGGAYPGVLGPWYAAVAAIGMVVAAMYLLIMVGKIVFGPLKEPAVKVEDLHESLRADGAPADLTLREIGILVPLAVICVVIGFYPKLMTDRLEPSIEAALAGYPARVSEMLAERGDVASEKLTMVHAPGADHDD